MSRAVNELVLEAGRAERNYWFDLWRYRELFVILAWRDIAVRYKQAILGVAWVLLQPLAQVMILVVVFSRLAKLPSDGGAPYSLMVLAAMLPWQFFASAISSSGQSIVGSAGLITKVYFPRLIIPCAAVVAGLVDFAIGMVILLGLMLVHGYYPSWRFVILPALLLLAVVAALGPGLLIAALNAEYRDFRYVIPFIVQFGLYISPVGFGSGYVREAFGETAFLFYSLNPMVGVIEGFRWMTIGEGVALYWPSVCMSILISSSLLGVGLYRFRRLERRFADVV